MFTLMLHGQFPNLFINHSILLKVFVIAGIIQLINLVTLIFILVPYKENKLSRKITHNQKAIMLMGAVTLLISALSSVIFISFAIEGYYSAPNEQAKFTTIGTMFMFYLVIFIPNYYLFSRRIRSKVLVEVHLIDGSILSSLILSHKTFGKNIFLYDAEKDGRNNIVIIPKEQIKFIISLEFLDRNTTSLPESELKSFSRKVIKYPKK